MEFDILNLKEEDGWEHHQIMDRLYEKNIEHYFVDVFPGEVAWITGCHARSTQDIARALNIPESIICYDAEHMFVFINLWQLRAMRKGFYLEE